jgi:hypothetical protein
MKHTEGQVSGLQNCSNSFFGTENSSAAELLLTVRFIAEVNVGIAYK